MATEIITCRVCGYEAKYVGFGKRGKINFDMTNMRVCTVDADPTSCPNFEEALNLPTKKV